MKTISTLEERKISESVKLINDEYYEIPLGKFEQECLWRKIDNIMKRMYVNSDDESRATLYKWLCYFGLNVIYSKRRVDGWNVMMIGDDTERNRDRVEWFSLELNRKSLLKEVREIEELQNKIINKYNN